MKREKRIKSWVYSELSRSQYDHVDKDKLYQHIIDNLSKINLRKTYSKNEIIRIVRSIQNDFKRKVEHVQKRKKRGKRISWRDAGKVKNE